MSLEIREIEMPEEPSLVLPVTDGRFDPDGDEGEAVKVWIRPLNGKDDQQISNAMMKLDRQGKGEFYAGTMDRIKVCCSVTKLEGVTVDGRPVDAITRRVYEQLPKWVLDRIKDKIASINSEMEDEELVGE